MTIKQLPATLTRSHSFNISAIHTYYSNNNCTIWINIVIISLFGLEHYIDVIRIGYLIPFFFTNKQKNYTETKKKPPNYLSSINHYRHFSPVCRYLANNVLPITHFLLHMIILTNIILFCFLCKLYRCNINTNTEFFCVFVVAVVAFDFLFNISLQNLPADQVV